MNAQNLHARSLLRTPAGIGRLGVLITVLVLICGLYFGSQLVSYAYSYYEIKGHIAAMAEQAGSKKDFIIRRFLMKHINKLEIPIENDEALKIDRQSGTITISLKYTEILYLDISEEYSWDLYYFDLNPKTTFRYE